MTLDQKPIAYPETLPERPEGWRKKMVFHINGGAGKHAATYDVFDDAGDSTPITYTYSESGKVAGFRLPGLDLLMTWSALRLAWPE